MTAPEAMRAATDAGMTFVLDGSKLRVRGGTPEAKAQLAPVIKPLAPEIAKLLRVACTLGQDTGAPCPAPECQGVIHGSLDDTRDQRQGIVLRTWTRAHEDRRAACRDWPAGGFAALLQRQPHLVRAIDRAETAADRLTIAWRDAGGDAGPWRDAVATWLRAYAAAGAWFAGQHREDVA